MFAAKLKAGVALVLAATLTVFMARGLIAQPDDAKKLAAPEGSQIAGKADAKDKQADISLSDADFVLVGTITDEGKTPVAGAKVTVLGSWWEENFRSAKSGMDGAFRMPLRFAYRDHLRRDLYEFFIAEGPKGELGFADVRQKKPEPVQFVVKAPTQLVVDVVDDAGKPVAGADVVVLRSIQPMVQGKTGADGRWTGRVPTDALTYDWSVIALKSKTGFDYWIGAPKRRPSPKAKEEPKADLQQKIPNPIRLTLISGQSVRVKTVDTDGKPVAGIKVMPWLIQKKGQDKVNLSGADVAMIATGPNGALFDWLPAFAQRIPFTAPYDGDFFEVENPFEVPGAKKPDAEVTIVVARTERLSGRVTQMDGRPAPGIRVEAEPVSDDGKRRVFYGGTRTDAEGRYSFKAYSNQALVIKVAEESWTARERRGWTVQPGKPIEGIDLVIKPKTTAATIDAKKAAAMAKNIADRKPFTNSIDMKFVWIPPGEFLMGSPADEQGRSKNESQHFIKLTRGFYMSVHPVTQEEWQEIMGDNPNLRFGPEKENLPIDSGSWNTCQEFIKKLSALEKRAYRLPTEAEWEYACRAGTTTPYYFGETISAKLANIDDGQKDRSPRQRMPVGSYPANVFGLRDMHAGIFQWCHDWYGEYPPGDAVDPQGPATGTQRVVRGGGAGSTPRFCRSASRHGAVEDRDIFGIGFRICFTE